MSNRINEPDYTGFGEHLQEHEDTGLPVGIKHLNGLAQKHGIPIPSQSLRIPAEGEWPVAWWVAREDQFVRQIRELETELANTREKLEEATKALEHYADELNWGISDGQDEPRFNDWYSPVGEDMRYRKAHGYDLARQVLDDTGQQEQEERR